MLSNCNDLRKCLILKSGDTRKHEEKTFIQDRQHLESVLGPSQESWFESLTACQIQSRKCSKVKQRWSVIDSPSSSPTVSQLIHVTVGSSPAGWRHSSPARYSDNDESHNAHISFDTPQLDSWERPLLGLSPGPSPIVHSIATLSRASSGGVYSLGHDDSALSWTNSLATPPRDESEMGSFADEADLSKTKDTARALFSPGSRLDTTGDSIRPLDSTFEEDQSDLDGSQSDNLQTSLSHLKAVGKQKENVSFESPTVNSPLHISLSQEVMSKADILKQSPAVVKHMENWKDNFKKRLILRKDSFLDSAKKFKSKDETSVPYSNSDNDDSNSKVEKDIIKKSPDIQFKTTEIQSQNKNEETQLSPTFSQKKRQPKPRTRKSPSISRDETSSVDYVLSDFFDPPSGSVGKRKPAPSRKRKSLEMEESLNSVEAADQSCNSIRVTLNDSATTEALQSILASDKKTRGSSNKKVRFSENVKKHTFIPEVNPYQKDGKHAGKVSKRKGSCLKLKNDSKSPSLQLKNKGIHIVLEREREILAENKHKIKNNETVIQNEHQKGKKVTSNEKSKAISYTKNNDKSENIKHSDNMKGTEEISEEELFSQVSPSALKEMCNVAEKHEHSLIDVSNSVGTLKADKDKNTGQVRMPKPKKFFYPSVSQLTNSSACKVFKFREEESKDVNRKVLLNSVKIKDIVDKDLEKQLEVQRNKTEDKGLVSEDEKENMTKQAQDQEKTSLSKGGMVQKNAAADFKLVGSGKNVESQCLRKLQEVSGIQKASGRQVKIPKEALEKATSLFQDEGKEMGGSYHNSVHATNQDFKKVQSLVTPVRGTNIERNEPVLCLPAQDVEKDLRDKTDVPIIKPENTAILQNFLTNSGINNSGIQFKGFESASGKALDISSEAVLKAVSLFHEDNLESGTNEGLKAKDKASPTAYNLEFMTNNAAAKVKTNSDISNNSEHGIAVLDKPNTTEHVVKGQSLNSSCIDVNLLQGFQSASGKVLHIPNKALEKAHSLLQEENFSPSSCSKQIMVTKDVRKLQENKVALELGDGLNDMEFSEWFDDEMESEGILFVEEAVKDEFDDTENQSNELNVRTPKSGVEDSESESSKISPNHVKSNLQMLNKNNVTNVTDEKERGTFDEAQDNGKFVGFQTASGKSMTLSKERIKQAEQLLIDSNSDNVLDLKECLDTSTVKPILKNHLEVNVSRMCGDKLPENLQSVLQQERIDMEGQNKPNLGCNENSNAIASSASSCYKESLAKKNELSSGRDGKKQTCDLKQTVKKTVEKDQTKMSVAERLKLEFENELHIPDNETNSKNIEDELNEIKRFKKSREVHLKEEKQHTINLVSRNKPPEKLHVCADAAMKPKGFRPFKPPKISRTADSGKYPESKRKDWNNENGNDLTSAESSNQDISKGKGRKYVTGSSDMKSTDMTMRKIGLQYSETKESIPENNIDTDYSKHERVQKVFQKENNSENEANLNNSNLNTSFNDIVCMSNRNFAEMNTSHVIGSNCSDHAKIGNDATTDFDDFSQMFDDEMDFTQMEGSGHANDKKEISDVTFEEINNEKEEKLTKHDVCDSSDNNNVNDIEIYRKTEFNENKLKSGTKDVCETSKNSHVFHTEIDDRKLTGNKNFVGFSSASGKIISVSKIALKSAVQMMSDYEKEIENTEDTAKDVHLLNIEGVQNSDSKLIEAKCEIANENEQTLFENNHLKPLIAENDVVNECSLSDEVKDNTDRLIAPEGEKLNVGNNEIKLIDKDIEIVTSKCEVSKHKVISVVETLQDTCEIAEEKGNTDLSSGKTASYQGKEVLNKDGSIDKGLKNDEEFAKSDSKPEFQRFNTALDQMVEAADKTLRHTRTAVGNDEDIVNLETENYVQQRKLDEKDESDCITEYHVCNKVSQNISEACGDNANTSSVHMNKIPKVRTFSQTSETDNLRACDNSTEIDGSEKAIDFQRYIHFQTASGLKINGSEKALNYAKGQLHDTDEKAKVQGVPKFDGFSTASGNKVIVSETALNNAKGQFHDTNDVVKTQSSHKFVGLSTASGNKVHVSEKALNFARGQFHDSNDEEKANNVPKFDCFSTASGNKVHVSEKALNHARGQFHNTCEMDKAQNVPKFDGFSTASGNKVMVSEKALNYARGQFHDSNDEDKFQDVPKFDGFSKASGNKVHVSDKALNFARGQFHESNDEDTSKNVPKLDGLSTASGSKVHVSEKALNYAREQLHDTCEMDKVQNIPKFDGFNTASRNKVRVSKKALDYAEGQCCDTNDEDKAQNMPKFDGFSTASGNKVHVSDKALKYARGQFLDTNDEDKAQNMPKFDGFSTASGSKVHVSEKALNYARGQFHDRNDEDINVPKFDGFSSASGNKVNVSEKALNYARGQFLDTNDEDKAQDVPKFDGFSTASGNKVHVSEKALNYARGQFLDTNDEDKATNVPKFDGFSTASENKVHVSEKALNYARGQFHDRNDEDINVPKFDGFSSASGNKFHVSEKALNYARRQLHDTCEMDKPQNVLKFDGFGTASGIKVNISEKALNYARSQFHDKNDDDTDKNVPNFCGFSTTSGNKVQVSEKALNYAKGQFLDTKNDDKTQNVPKFDGFSTASGNKVNVSGKALDHARGKFHDTDEIDQAENVLKFDGFSTASGNKVHVSEKALNSVRGQFLDKNNKDKATIVPKFDGFSTASGNKINVSEKALSYARGQLNDTDNMDKAQDVPKFDGFSTASGNKVHISEKALIYARGQLHDTGEMDETQNVPRFDGLSTASGNKVNVSEKVSNYARGQLHDVCEMDKAQNVPKFDVECNNGETKNNVRNAKNMHNKKVFENKERQSELIRLDSDLVQGILKSESRGKDDSEMSVKCGLDDDLEEVFGMALKRRKLNLNTERKVLQKLADEGPLGRRKPGRNSNEVSVASTDKRHPGFRPFKPVFCKITDSKGARKDDDPGSAKHEGTTFSSSDSKSSFQIPYRNKSEKNNLPPSTTNKAHGSILKSESGFGIGAGDGDHHGLSTVNTLEISLSGDCPNTTILHPAPSERTDKLKEPIPTANFVSTTVKDDEQIIEPCKNDTALQGNNDSCQEISSEENVTCNTLDAKSKNDKKLETVLVKNNVMSSLDCDLSETGQKAEQSEFDSFSQDEDDVYYCTLVEARRNQEEIIKQRALGRVHPVAGKLWRMKQTENKIKLTDVIDELNQVLDRSAKVKAAYAADYKFSMEFYYGKNTAHAKIGEGAFIVPDDAGYLGKQEFYRGFLTIEGVDDKLISDSWVFNHYRWIIWKLAAYENTSSCLRTKSLTPDMVMLQLKYRYDREVDQSQRSSLKKIYEKDDTPSKRLVLCVAAVIKHDLQETKADQTKSGLNQGVYLELTDGWYSIPTQIDGPLTQLVLQGKICVGHKLCITGADLIGGEDACTPLEAPSSIMLKICRNSTRPAPWDSTLGYQRDPRPLCVPLSGLDGDGGIAGVIDVVIVRKYPTLYMEKLCGGGCVFRTRRCEDRERQEFDSRKQREMEKVYRQMEQTAEKEEKLERRRSGMTKFKRSDIENLQSGQDIYDAMETAAQPDMIQNYLSDYQLSMLYEYKRQQQEHKQADLNTKFSRAWQEKLETFPERVVTPVLKFRVAGCANRDLDLNTSTILTVWRPSPEISDLQEGHRYKIYSVNTSVSRSKYTGHSIQLTATKQTRFRRMQLNENILDSIYEPREVLWASDIKRRQPPFGELDFVGVIVRITKSSLNDRICDMVYLADCQLGILAVRFWNGFKNFGEDLFMVGQVLCCSNLMDKSAYRYSQIPIVEVSPEFTHITNKSQNAAQRKALDRLNVASKDKTGFMEKADTAIETLSVENKNQSIAKKISEINEDFIADIPRSNPGKHEKETGNLNDMDNIDLGNDSFEEDLREQKTYHDDEVSADVDPTALHNSMNTTNNDEKECEAEVKNKLDNKEPDSAVEIMATPRNDRKHLIAQRKMARLASYGSPSVLSPLSATVPRSVTKGFKPPAFKKL